MQVKKAELELCDTLEQRVEAYAALLVLAKEFEKVREALYKGGRCTPSDLTEARVRVLEAETAYEEAKIQSHKKR